MNRLSEMQPVMRQVAPFRLLHHLPDMAWLKEGLGRFWACNQAFERFTGVPEADFLQPDHALARQWIEWLRTAELALLNGQSLEPMRCWLHSPADGQTHFLEIMLSVLWHQDGQPEGVLGLARDITQQYLLDQALHQSEARFRAIFEGAQALAIQGYDQDGVVLYWNQASEQLYGYSATEAVGRSMFDLIIPDQVKSAVKMDISNMFRMAIAAPARRVVLRHKNRQPVQVFSSHAMVRANCGELTLFCMDVDLLDLVRAEAAQSESEQRYRTLFNATGDGILLLKDGIVRDCNHAANVIFATIAGVLNGMSLLSLLVEMQSGGRDSAMLLNGVFQESHCHTPKRMEWRHRRPNGTEFDAEWVLTVVQMAQENFFLLSFRDITEKKQSAQLIWHQANHDSLTGLSNRHYFLDRLSLELRKATRHNRSLALLLIDLDHFKEVNDSLGHVVGDMLLIEVARRLQVCVRDSDTVARLGGDEFMIMISEMEELDGLDRICQQVLLGLTAPFYLHGKVAYVSASIGITVYPDDGIAAEALQNHADQAMYAAKRLGRNRYCYFTPAMQEQALARVSLGNDLRAPAAASQFRLMYQPIVNLQTGKVEKVEALLRWEHPERGLVAPEVFIPLTEDIGLVVEIGNWVFREAVNQIRYWRKQLAPDLQVSINVSPVQFYSDKTLLDEWVAYLDTKSVPGEAVVLEITERLLLDERDVVIRLLRRFQEAGVKIALDDFGTGYSSLSYLKHFRIDYLKIDRTFISDLEQGNISDAVSEAIVTMAHRLNVKVIAEGVESALQSTLLKAVGCDYVQGFYYAEPLSVADFEALFLQEGLWACEGD